MNWEKVREEYPGSWVKLKVLDSHTEDNIKVIDEMEVIEVIDPEKVAAALKTCINDITLFHTTNEKIRYKVIPMFGFRKNLY